MDTAHKEYRLLDTQLYRLMTLPPKSPWVWVWVCGVWCVGVWCVVCGVWCVLCVVCCVLCVVCCVLCVVCCVLCVVCCVSCVVCCVLCVVCCVLCVVCCVLCVVCCVLCVVCCVSSVVCCVVCVVCCVSCIVRGVLCGVLSCGVVCFVLLCVCVCVQKNTRKRNKKGEQKRWKHGDNSVGKYKKVRNIGEIIKTRPLFWHDMVNYGPKNVRKQPFSPTHCFLHSPWDLPTCSAEGSNSKRLKIPFWARGPHPKVLIMHWKWS